ncbi:hypothetical protein [Streptomyces coeruleorubidus]
MASPQRREIMVGRGHWLLETHLEEVVARVRDFLGRGHVQQPAR